MVTRHPIALGLAVVVCALALFPAAASARERCCFRVQTTVTGTVHVLYEAPQGSDGFRPRGALNGRYDIEWSWTLRHLAEYRESDDRRRLPFLSVPEICRRRKCRFSAVKLRVAYRESNQVCEWTSPQDTDGDGQPDGQGCAPLTDRVRCNPNWGFSSGGRFVALGGLGNDWAADFTQPGFQVLEVGHLPPTQVPGVTMEDGRRCLILDHGPETNDAGVEMLGSGWKGSMFNYQVILPPPRRAHFRRGERFGTGRKSTVTDHGPEEGTDTEKRRHTMTASGGLEVSFVWFPERKLRREARKLDRLQ